jgi:GrpB-like predicted nucleotidyltransferase (UPF0157 family)
MTVERVIGPYPVGVSAACREYDPRAPEVARRVGALIRQRRTRVLVEHVGSTAVPGCAGKGVVDLLLPYRGGGELAAIGHVLDDLGFQRQRSPTPFPEDRPMRLGALDHDGATFLLHVHVVPADAPEVVALRAFRDRLRVDVALVASYVARKRAIIGAGVVDGRAYSLAKGAFIQAIVGRDEQP